MILQMLIILSFITRTPKTGDKISCISVYLQVKSGQLKKNDLSLEHKRATIASGNERKLRFDTRTYMFQVFIKVPSSNKMSILVNVMF